VKKPFELRVILLLLVVASLFSACATSENSTGGDSGSLSATSGTPVPGEKLNDEGKFTPGGPGSSGSVHW